MENDRAFADVLNDCLDAIEAEQASVKDCLARYPQHAAALEELLRLSSQVSSVPLPAFTPEKLAAGEQRLLQAARARVAKGQPARTERSLRTTLSERVIEPVKAKIRAWPKWAVPTLAVAGSMAALFVCVLFFSLGAGATWWALRDKDVAPGDSRVSQSHSPLPTATSERSVTQSPTQTPDQGEANTVFLPSVIRSLPPESAMLQDLRGLVEIQAGGKAWALAGEGQTLQAGQRVRTGALSGARVTFYDGSAAILGPKSELSVDHLGQDATDGARVIQLTQWMGESDHDVVSAESDNARYEVDTPSGTGEAMGTVFHVLVTPDLFARFSVTEGVVAVTHVDVTVIVVAGQLTTIPAGQPPREPVFRLTGEGEVTRIGSEWEIGGQVFVTNERTTIVGNPQVRDWVSVQGHLLPDNAQMADRIVLLRRSPENRFTMTGEVETITEVSWIVAGKTIGVTEGTDIQEGIQEQDTVRVKGLIQEDGTLVALSIRLIEEQGLPFGFAGIVSEISDTSWVISGVTVTVDAGTRLEDGLVVGDTVQVRGTILDGESWLARSIVHLAHRERTFGFVGTVESIDPWVVNGIALERRAWTEIGDGIVVGARVKVEGHILADGTWVADEIEQLDRQAYRFNYVGLVSSTEPWVVGGVPLAVDKNTKIQGHVVAGMLARVKGKILPDGTWLATEIKPASPVGRGRGCFTLGMVVTAVHPGQVQLGNGMTVDLDGITGADNAGDGELAANSIVLLQLCFGDDDTIHVVSLIVVLVPPPPPPPLPPGLCGPCRGGVTYFTLRYVGIVPDAHVQVLGKKGRLLFDGIVQPGGTFSFSGADKNGKMGNITIVVHGQVSTEIHTSCSKPVHPGIVYGEFQIVAGASKNGGLLCPEPAPTPHKDGSKGGSKDRPKGGSKGGSKDRPKGGSKGGKK